MAKSGMLSVQVRSDSDFFRSSVPVEVRDSTMRLVKRERNERRFGLPAGWYEVSAVLEDGRRYSELVEVRAGRETPVELGVSRAAPSAAPESWGEKGLESFGEKGLEALPRSEAPDELGYERPRYTERIDDLPKGKPQPEPWPVAELIKSRKGDTEYLVQGATLIREAHLLWVFECTSQLDSVATALLRVGEQRIQLSLPLSMEGGYPSNTCAVRVDETPTGAQANAWIAAERTVANALQNMWAAGYLLKAASMAEDAVDLLRYKYSDPTGAALGALILHRVGKLERYTSWVENLVRDFDWLPDGKVLLAHLWQDDESKSDQALELAIEASAQRMLYSESYSLLLELLRRWQRTSDEARLREATNSLASRAPYINWESICLSEVVQEDESCSK